MKWKKLKSKIVYKNKWIKLIEDDVIRPDGKKGKYSIVERPPANFIIAVNHNNNIFFIREYRYPIKKSIVQLPAGLKEKNMTNLASAKKELLEETGITAKEWKKIGKFYIGPGHENIYSNVYLAKNLTIQKTPVTKQNDELIYEVMEIPIPKIKHMIISGKIECGITLASLNLYFQIKN